MPFGEIVLSTHFWQALCFKTHECYQFEEIIDINWNGYVSSFSSIYGIFINFQVLQT